MNYRLLKDHDYAVIDQAQLHESVGELPLVPLAPQRFLSDAHLLPALLALNEMTDDARDNLHDRLNQQVQAGRPTLCSCLLSYRYSKHALVSHLKRHLIATPPQGQQVLFRFYDSRVFRHLRWILDPAQVNALFGGISRWTYIDQGRWHTVESQLSKPRSILRFTGEQWASIQRIGLVNRVLVRLELPPETDTCENGRQVDGLLNRAQTDYGLTARDDLVAFAMYGMRWHANFDRHPQIATILSDHIGKQGAFRDATALMRSPDWRRIVDELNSPESMQV